jgi:ATP-dependent protease Clp ATPase subunit
MTDQPLKEELRCGFCAKAQSEVKQLVLGWQSSICNECIALSLAILATRDRVLFDTAVESARARAEELTNPD